MLVERYATLGGVCLNVGCIPSKALLHVAAVMDEVSATWPSSAWTLARPRQRGPRQARPQGRSSASSPAAWPPWPRCARSPWCAATARCWAPPLEVEELTTGTSQDKTGGTKKVVAFKRHHRRGSQAVRLPFMPRTTRAWWTPPARWRSLACPKACSFGRRHHRPGNGHGVQHAGRPPDVVEMMDGLMQGADRDLVKVWQKMNAPASTTSCSTPRRCRPRPRPKASR